MGIGWHIMWPLFLYGPCASVLGPIDPTRAALTDHRSVSLFHRNNHHLANKLEGVCVCFCVVLFLASRHNPRHNSQVGRKSSVLSGVLFLTVKCVYACAHACVCVHLLFRVLNVEQCDSTLLTIFLAVNLTLVFFFLSSVL